MIARVAVIAILVLHAPIASAAVPAKPPSFDEVNAAEFTAETPQLRAPDAQRRIDPLIIKIEVLLDRANASPGVIDGWSGDNLGKAISAFEEMSGLPVDGRMSMAVWQALQRVAGTPPLTIYTITERDERYPFNRALPSDYGKLARLRLAAYRSPLEMLAERFHMDRSLLAALNPDVDFAEPGRRIIVAAVEREPVTTPLARIVVDNALGAVRAYGADGRLLLAYPATIGSEDTPSPSGTHKVASIERNPVYHYDPERNFLQGHNMRPLRLPPGPNNPVGLVWIGLTKPSYGIHGTPDPSRIDKTGSHGCVRLTNWDALHLAGLVRKGLTVEFRT